MVQLLPCHTSISRRLLGQSRARPVEKTIEQSEYPRQYIGYPAHVFTSYRLEASSKLMTSQMALRYCISSYSQRKTSEILGASKAYIGLDLCEDMDGRESARRPGFNRGAHTFLYCK
jgi:capsule polysaccharide modification protein KpsS